MRECFANFNDVEKYEIQVTKMGQNIPCFLTACVYLLSTWTSLHVTKLSKPSSSIFAYAYR